MDLTYFNPLSQKEADFLASFVARRQTLEFFLHQLKLLAPTQAARHHLIVAPRGFGKTSLLRRIAIAVRQDEALAKKLVPLTFREEQHNVISLDVFWRNCLQSLQEARELEQAPQAELDALDALWANHKPRQELPRAEQDGEQAWQALHEHCSAAGRRPLLLIDNLDTLLAGLSEQHQWALRKRLQADDGPMLIAAASRYPSSTHDIKAAFYDFFRMQTLDRLDNHEVFTCLRNFAQQRGALGKRVLDLLSNDPGRIAALNTMAGGNPRTLSVLYGVLESHMSADVLSQLSAMLDTFTGWYQARTEELPMQARAVFDALALNWAPITAAELGQITGLETPAVSSQLARLEKSGYVESVALSKRITGRTGFQVSERFFNIWYLMRNGPKQAKQGIRFLTVFLQSCFSVGERRTMAKVALGDGIADPRYALALADSLGSALLRDQLIEMATLRFQAMGQLEENKGLIEGMKRQTGKAPKAAQRPADPPKAQEAVDQAAEVLEANGPSTALAERQSLARTLFFDTIDPVNNASFEDQLIACNELVSRFGADDERGIQELVAYTLANRAVVLDRLGRPQESVVACDDAVDYALQTNTPNREPIVGTMLRMKVNSLARLGLVDQSEATYLTLAKRSPDSPLPHLFFGELLLNVVGDPIKARLTFESGLAPKTSLHKESDRDRRTRLHANLAYAIGLHSADKSAARAHVSSALANPDQPSQAGRMLLQALPVWDDELAINWQRVFDGIGKAVASNDPRLWTDYIDDLQRLMWFVIFQHQGPAFKRWMEASGYVERYAPLYHAFVAALEGEDHLLQINAETQKPAADIYKGLAKQIALYGRGEKGKPAKSRGQ